VLGSIGSLLAASNGSSGSSGVAVLLPIVLMGAIFYFLLIRPQRRQRQQHRQLVEGLDVGDEVVTIGGVYGTVRALDDESITLEVAPGVDMRFARGAVARKLVYDEEDYDQDEPAGEEEEAGDQK
jgi:preprotein translocase subunit YajC